MSQAFIEQVRKENGGTLPHVSWPGCYPLYYLTEAGSIVCPKCANTETSDPASSFGANWEDASLHCDDCGERIPAAYAEEE